MSTPALDGAGWAVLLIRPAELVGRHRQGHRLLRLRSRQPPSARPRWSSASRRRPHRTGLQLDAGVGVVRSDAAGGPALFLFDSEADTFCTGWPPPFCDGDKNRLARRPSRWVPRSGSGMVSSSSRQQPERVLADPNPILYREVRRNHPVRGMETSREASTRFSALVDEGSSSIFLTGQSWLPTERRSYQLPRRSRDLSPPRWR